MIARWYFLILALLFAPVLLAAQTTATPARQLAIEPDGLTNRRMGNPNDASSVGWNPALLGMRDDFSDVDMLLGLPYVEGYSLDRGIYAAFLKFGPVAFGSTGPIGDSALFPRQYYAGIGLPVIADYIWAGASAHWYDGRGFGPSAEYTIAGAIAPIPTVLAGVTIANLTGNNDRSMRFNLDAAWFGLSWATLHSGLRFDGDDTAGGRSGFGASIGASLGVSSNQIMISGQYDVVRSVLGVGIEMSLGEIGFGSVNQFDGTEMLSGAALFRYGNVERALGRGTPSGRVDPRGWQPDRAFTPIGLEYRYKTTDASRNLDALVRSCRPGEAPKFDSPSEVVSAVNGSDGAYPQLAAVIRKLTSNPADLYKKIRQEYYSTALKSRELGTNDSLQIVSRQGHSIGVQAVDPSRFPQVSVLMQVTDPAGRNVSGLGTSDFAFRDPSVKILSVRPTDSSFNVPVDVVMMIDCSGSMGDEIASVLANAQRFVETMESRGANYRIGGVLYGSIMYDTLHPTSDFDRFRDFLSGAQAIGGDEISSLAIKAATEMNFRANSQRVFVMITDDWVLQDNSQLTENDLTQMLWDARARLYTIGDPCKNNNAITTRLTLGREYDITSPFNSILDEIGSDITTIYQLVYESKIPEPKVTILQGRVRDDAGRPASVALTFAGQSGSPITVQTNQTTGEYQVVIREGISYQASINGQRYLPLAEQVDLTATRQGDTVTRDFTLRTRPTTLAGRVTDENGNPVQGEIRIDDAATLERSSTVATNSAGEYTTDIQEGKTYRITAAAPDHVPSFIELDTRNVEQGTNIIQDLNVMSIDAAIASGTAFKLKNIFFDYDKWDVKTESMPELNRLAELLAEYPTIRVEIGAHTDSRGGDQYNMDLSTKRARAVMDYLISRGMAPERLSSKGYGETVAVASNDTEEGRALNRRVEFKLVK